MAFELNGTPANGFFWNVLQQRNGSNTWAWDRVWEEGAGSYYTRHLNPGTHQIKIYKIHSNVPIDKILITRSTSYNPAGLETENLLFSDDFGQAATAWSLGETAGVNKLQARAFSATEAVTFEAQGLPDLPVAMEKANDNQVGAARDTLSNPFTVTLYSEF